MKHPGTAEDLLKDTGLFLQETIAPLIVKTGDALGINKALAELICDLTGGALASECLAKLLTENIPDLLNNLDDLFCKKDSSALSEDQMIDFLDKFGCFLDDTAHTDDALKELLTGEDAGPVIASVLDTIKEGLVDKGILSDLGCVVTGAVLGKNSLTGGGGGGAGGGGDAGSLPGSLGR